MTFEVHRKYKSNWVQRVYVTATYLRDDALNVKDLNATLLQL